MSTRSHTIIAPSLLAANFCRVGEAVQTIQDSGADWIHLDIMDGSFVPNITFGKKMVEDVAAVTKLPIDVHLMIVNPEQHIQDFVDAGAAFITLHVEATVHAHRALMLIRNAGIGAGLAIVPSTPVSALEEMMPELDMALVMSVNPGFGGQTLIPLCLDKIRRLKELRSQKGTATLISVDGGINSQNAAAVRAAGADILVCGSAFFNAPDPCAEVGLLRGTTQKTV
ncbi:MAG: ribulose-phosphate 3-epimerase [Spirochaetaceae bacterium]|nr:MAG: ribulose-phosphate 3-epimerase [Spirochaetaceae bacterium]